MKTDDYIVDGKVARNLIAIDIRERKITRGDIEQLVLDKRIQSAFLNKTFDKKVPPNQWDKDYLEELTYAALAQSFNRDYLLYLDEVAEFVAQSSKRKKKIGTAVCVTVIAAACFLIGLVIWQICQYAAEKSEVSTQNTDLARQMIMQKPKL